jgi:hypothetical protein
MHSEYSQSRISRKKFILARHLVPGLECARKRISHFEKGNIMTSITFGFFTRDIRLVPYRHRGGRIKKINAWYLNTLMVYL